MPENISQQQQVIDYANSQIGYKETPVNKTKYSADIDANYPNFYNTKKQGAEWCDIFVDYCFLHCFGETETLKMLCQPKKSAGAGCKYSAQYYKNAKQWFTEPKMGDQIFFYVGGKINHTGLVAKVDSKKVYTIEGNSDDQVATHSYTLTNKKIAGYGRPKYTEVQPQPAPTPAPAPAPAPTPTPATDGATKFVTNLYVYALGRQPDEAGLNNWVNQLTSKKIGGANVAQGIIFSQECINRKLSDNAWVDMLYPAVLGRPADAAGKQNWVNQLKAGVSREQVFYNFVTSTEFANYCKFCGIEVGKISAPAASKPTTSTPTTAKPATNDKAIRVGDTVKIAPTAKYYNGASIPSWVKNLTWKVSAISGNRAILGRSSNGRYNINSPINTVFLTKV